MKKFLSLLLLYPALLFAQSVPIPPNSFGTLADLRNQQGTANVQVLLNGLVSINDGNGGTYMWSPTSIDADDGFITVKVASVNTGRWKRIGNGNTLKGTKTLSGGALQTAYNVTYDTPLPFTPLTIIVNPRSANAAVPSWVSAITNTGFTINFSSVPILGTNNIVIDFIVVKQ